MSSDMADEKQTTYDISKPRHSTLTVSYNLDVSSVNSFTFVKLLMRWRGSFLKSVRWELITWIVFFVNIQLIYRYLMNDKYQRLFESTSLYLNAHLVYIPLTFMLGFFVTIVVDRWRSVFTNIAFIDNVALSIAALIRGSDNHTITLRQTIIRYLVLSQVLVLRDISMRVRKKYPNLESLIDTGFVCKDELSLIRDLQTPFNKYWLPVNWVNSLIYKAFESKNIDSVQSMNAILHNVNEFRQSMEMLCKYDWVPIPIAYPQVVFLAVRVYFLICLISRQYLLIHSPQEHQSIIPFMTILQFIFFVGWMKVAEALLNPLGEDDDDFECNWLIEKNMSTGLLIVDTTSQSCPPLKFEQPPNNLTIPSNPFELRRKMNNVMNMRTFTNSVQPSDINNKNLCM